MSCCRLAPYFCLVKLDFVQLAYSLHSRHKLCCGLATSFPCTPQKELQQGCLQLPELLASAQLHEQHPAACKRFLPTLPVTREFFSRQLLAFWSMNLLMGILGKQPMYVATVVLLPVQIQCAFPCYSGAPLLPQPTFSTSNICDGADVHLGPGAFLDYPTDTATYRYVQQPLTLARCPGEMLMAAALPHCSTMLASLSVSASKTAKNELHHVCQGCIPAVMLLAAFSQGSSIPLCLFVSPHALQELLMCMPAAIHAGAAQSLQAGTLVCPPF